MVKQQYQLRPSLMTFVFGDGSCDSLGTLEIRMPLPNGSFLPLLIDVVKADIPLLLGLEILDRERLVADNVDNILDGRWDHWKLPIHRKYGQMLVECGTRHPIHQSRTAENPSPLLPRQRSEALQPSQASPTERSQCRNEAYPGRDRRSMSQLPSTPSKTVPISRFHPWDSDFVVEFDLVRWAIGRGQIQPRSRYRFDMAEGEPPVAHFRYANTVPERDTAQR